MAKEFPIFVGGRFKKTSDEYQIKAPFDGMPVGITYRAGSDEVIESIEAAVKAFEITRTMAPYQRSAILDKISAGISLRKEEIARTIALEAGKPISTARIEVDRSIFTYRYAAEEAKRIHGEIIPLDIHVLGKGRTCFVKRFPIGPIFGISPFNFPMNLVAHKVAPAIAVGNPIILKPASQTPLTSLILAEIVKESGLPEGAFSVLPCTPSTAEAILADDRIKMLSFTGSPLVGWALKAKAGIKKVALELGGNAAVIVHSDADLPDAAARIATGGFSYSGQTCISVQRTLVHRAVYDDFRALLVETVSSLNTGDPLNETTAVGPLISEKEAWRVKDWVDEAVDGGAKIVCGGGCVGAVMEPTVLEGVSKNMKVNCMEIFGPVVTLSAYDDIDEALKEVNNSDFGLQAGIFTSDLNIAMKAWDTLDVGGVNIGDVPTFRIDHMPYGGVKQSGMGREGIRYAIEEMTELKNLVINHP